MSSIFDLRRFCKYFVYDLKNAKDKFGLSLIVTAISPVIVYAILLLIRFMFSEHFNVLSEAGRFTVFLIASATAIMSYPAKVYGDLTKKSSGTGWLMLPASLTEKFVSMLVVSLVVFPLAFYSIFFLSDYLVTLLPYSYGGSLLKYHDVLSSSQVYINLPLELISIVVVYTLAFLLGAVCFKKNKTVMTILCIFAVTMVMGSMVIPFAISNEDMVKEFFMSGNTDFRTNLIWYAQNLTVLFALLAGLFFRLKTLKH